ncbi:alpha-E domain-containing protein [Microlunatus panaciterrae]|uniref:Alpha-E superfamily protein n=1 Tax=Microlunatus panaciterrae TaxID=400768 RepID=A0ABS2RIG9_9ACTN|nr:alpha-E domain-containing protein [Microlunatus panaciterrae]MBM7798785.1 putative alpha-E superfamily protein [Microlunatus panaciterrae]
MLSRIAESLFWIGRYCERAEDTARLLQVHLRLLVEDTSLIESTVCADLLSLMGVDHVAQPTQEDVLRVLGYDGSEPNSIVASWRAARDNARRAREVIPLELWECINTTWHQLPSGRFGPGRSHSFLDWARERSALFTGIARGTMVRDEGWQFLLLGRSLEQANMTARVVAAAASTRGGSTWPTTLRSCGAHDAFLRTYRGFQADREAAEFLILDSRFPRSVMHGLVAATHCLETVTRANASFASESAEALRALGALRAHLQYSALDDLLIGLDGEMMAVQQTCGRVTSTITNTFFAAQSPRAWITEGAW